eukprot:584339-Amphidinium_carterae.1
MQSFRLLPRQGQQCEFCHLCDAGEKKRRRREKVFTPKNPATCESEHKVPQDVQMRRGVDAKLPCHWSWNWKNV